MGQKIDYIEALNKIVGIIEERKIAGINEISMEVFGSKSMRIVLQTLLIALCLYDVIGYSKVGNALVFYVKNKENLKKLIEDWKIKIWL